LTRSAPYEKSKFLGSGKSYNFIKLTILFNYAFAHTHWEARRKPSPEQKSKTQRQNKKPTAPPLKTSWLVVANGPISAPTEAPITLQVFSQDLPFALAALNGSRTSPAPGAPKIGCEGGRAEKRVNNCCSMILGVTAGAGAGVGLAVASYPSYPFHPAYLIHYACILEPFANIYFY